MPDIFEVFSDKATTYLNFNGTRFRLDYQPSILTPRLFAQLAEEAKADGDEDEGETVVGDDGEEYNVFDRDSKGEEKERGDALGLLPRVLAKVLLGWDVEIGGEVVPIEQDALMAIPSVFLGAVWQAITNDQSSGRNKRKEGRKEKRGSFQ